MKFDQLESSRLYAVHAHDGQRSYQVTECHQPIQGHLVEKACVWFVLNAENKVDRKFTFSAKPLMYGDKIQLE